MKKFNNNLCFFVTGLIFLISGAFFFGYVSVANSSYFKLAESADKLVLGHSHAECAYNDSLITGLVNFGKSGEAYFYTYTKLKKILPQNPGVKTIFIEFENTQIDRIMDSWTWDNDHIYRSFPRYFPIFSYSDLKFIWQKNSGAVLSCSPRSFFNEFGENFYSAYLSSDKVQYNHRFGGYLHLVRDKTDSLVRSSIRSDRVVQEKRDFEYSEVNLYFLSRIIEYCKEQHVKVFLIRSPLHPRSDVTSNEPALQEFIRTSFADVSFLDFKNFPLKDSEFGDLEHLNFRGARKYSVFFNQLMEKNLLESPLKQSLIDYEISKISVKDSSMQMP